MEPSILLSHLQREVAQITGGGENVPVRESLSNRTSRAHGTCVFPSVGGHVESPQFTEGKWLAPGHPATIYGGQAGTQSAPRQEAAVGKILGSDETRVEILVLSLTSCLRPGSFSNPLRFNSLIYKVGNDNL